MSKQQIFANCTSQQSLNILDVPASWALLCSGPDVWFEEDFARIVLDNHENTQVQADSWHRQPRKFRKTLQIVELSLRSGHLHQP